jgi:hypothetical protein
MNLSSSSNYFHIKKPFINYFLWFYKVLDWASISVKHRGYSTTNHETQSAVLWMAGSISKRSRVSYAKSQSERVSLNIGRPIRNHASRLTRTRLCTLLR